MSAPEVPSGRRPIAAVVGSARDGSAGEEDAEILGRALVDAGFRIVTGGLGGVMRAASRGARASASSRPGDVIAVLPSYSADDANEFVDIPICTGLQHGRNLIVAATLAERGRLSPSTPHRPVRCQQAGHCVGPSGHLWNAPMPRLMDEIEHHHAD